MRHGCQRGELAQGGWGSRGTEEEWCCGWWLGRKVGARNRLPVSQPRLIPLTLVLWALNPLPSSLLQGAPGDDLPADLATYQTAMVGQAIEVRICAEDPAHNYRPCTGTLGLVAWPKRTECRVDTWVETGVEVSGEKQNQERSRKDQRGSEEGEGGVQSAPAPLPGRPSRCWKSHADSLPSEPLLLVPASLHLPHPALLPSLLRPSLPLLQPTMTHCWPS